MAKNIIVSRKAAILIVSISLFILGFQILNVNIPDDIDITSGFSPAVASMDSAVQPEQPKQIEMPVTITAPAPPVMPPIDLVALRIKRTEELARIDYERMKLTEKYIRGTPALPKLEMTKPLAKTFHTTCYDPNHGYFACTVHQ